MFKVMSFAFIHAAHKAAFSIDQQLRSFVICLFMSLCH